MRRSATLEDRFREPAAGFLELTSPVFVLQGVLLAALAAELFAPKDAARVGSAAVPLTSTS